MALTSINSLKQIYSNLFNHPTDIMQIITEKITSSSNVTQDQMSQIIKNAMNRVKSHNISVGGINIIAKTIVAKIEEIDIEGDMFKEMTIVDLEIPFCPVVIDLTYAQADEIENKKIHEGQTLILTIISKTSSRGMTETWQLINIDEILI